MLLGDQRPDLRLDRPDAEAAAERIAADGIGQSDARIIPWSRTEHPVGNMAAEHVDRVAEAISPVHREVIGKGPQVGHRLERGERQRQERGIRGDDPRLGGESISRNES